MNPQTAIIEVWNKFNLDCRWICEKEFFDDLCQDLYLELRKAPGDKVMDLYSRGELFIWTVGIAKHLIYHARKKEGIFVHGTTQWLIYIEEDNLVEKVYNWIDQIPTSSSDYYYKNLLRLYLKLGCWSTISRKTGINRVTLNKNKKYLAKILKQLKDE